MKKKVLVILIILAALAIAAIPASATQNGFEDLPDNLPKEGFNTDNPSHPLGERQNALKQEGFEAILNGNANGPVVQVAQGQYVELEREGEDSIWTLIADFGDAESPYGSLQGGMVGPQHNQIPEPDRSVDNTTIWREDFSRDYYMDTLFSEEPGAISMRNFYIEQSSNRYAVNGDVTNWVQVPYRTAHYGRDWCGSIVCSTTWWFIEDSLAAWTAGMTTDEINDYLAQFDVWDRYDQDGDGNFNEPDGYIDHFQIVHAGEGQEAGGGAYGSDAIWSHRWYVQTTCIGCGGPTLEDGTVVPYGGTQIGDSNYWIGDYTIEPENGGVGVFAHEFGHDLGLPDLYDTAGNTCGSACENSTAFWTLMSSGSWTSDGTVDIGSMPVHMGAWEKFQLGWLNYEVAFAGAKSEHKLGPAETNTKQAQGVFVVLPKKYVEQEVGEPFEGDYFFFSGSGNNLDNTMTRDFTLPASNPMLTAKVNFDIEVDWDYAYLEVNGTPVETNFSTTTDPNGQNFGFGITGSSSGWADLTADLSAYAGQTVTIGFRYWTDVAVANPGFLVDNIEVDGYPMDGGETDTGWSYAGFVRTTGTEILGPYSNYYLAEFRQYRGFDDALRTGPYNFFSGTNMVEHFPYQDGLLISYWDTSAPDNSTSAHPGWGLILPIDAHPEAMYHADGVTPWRGRIQSYDSTFSLEPTDGLVFESSIGGTFVQNSLPGVSIFDDLNEYYNPVTPTLGVEHPHTGTQIRIKSVSALGSFMQIQVRPSK